MNIAPEGSSSQLHSALSSDAARWHSLRVLLSGMHALRGTSNADLHPLDLNPHPDDVRGAVSGGHAEGEEPLDLDTRMCKLEKEQAVAKVAIKTIGKALHALDGSVHVLKERMDEVEEALCEVQDLQEVEVVPRAVLQSGVAA